MLFRTNFPFHIPCPYKKPFISYTGPKSSLLHPFLNQLDGYSARFQGFQIGRIGVRIRRVQNRQLSAILQFGGFFNLRICLDVCSKNFPVYSNYSLIRFDLKIDKVAQSAQCTRKKSWSSASNLEATGAKALAARKNTLVARMRGSALSLSTADISAEFITRKVG